MAKADELRRLMATEGASVKRNTNVFNAGRYDSVADLEDYEALKDEARGIKEDAIERLPELIETVRESVEENGGHVYLADDADDATRYVSDVVAAAEAERVVKSKSMTTEEVELNEILEEVPVDVVETDLGEWILQLADESPSHIVAPAIHKSREEIAALMNDRFDPPEPLETAQELTRFARDQLGELIREGDVGVTGANFITADSGTILLVTSEGNARRSVAATDVHVAVAGVEKIVPSVADLQPFVELIGRSATGQDITSYMSLLTSPGETPVVDFGDGDTPLSEHGSEREFHLVLVDNGRLAMREDEQLRETLYCIRCSACANSCANFQSVGGHAFGGETYSGGIATGWEAGIEGLDVAAEFNDLCTGCSRCVNACPVKIDIPWINTVVRDRVNRDRDTSFDWLVDGLSPDPEAGGVPLQKRFFGNFDTVAKLGSALAPLSNWAAERGVSRWILDRVLDVDSRRALPEFRRETFVDWAAGMDTRRPDADRSVVVYPDLYTNHVLVERGIATVEVLHALGVDVIVPSAPSSGRAPLSQGMVSTARDHAERVHETLEPHLADGRDVVVIEPSDLAMFRREYERLLPPQWFATLAERSHEALAYVHGCLEAGADPADLQRADGTPVAYHAHCQQRTLGLEAHTVAVLERLGYDVLTSDVECCGMAGSFGYKSEYYELSMDVGADLRDQFSGDEAIDRTVLATGTSCLEQLDALLDRSARHPAELIAPA